MLQVIQVGWMLSAIFIQCHKFSTGLRLGLWLARCRTFTFQSDKKCSFCGWKATPDCDSAPIIFHCGDCFNWGVSCVRSGPHTVLDFGLLPPKTSTGSHSCFHAALPEHWFLSLSYDPPECTVLEMVVWCTFTPLSTTVFCNSFKVTSFCATGWSF